MQVSAVVMHGPRSMSVEKFDLPESPPPGGAILKVLANGVCGSDYDIYTGRLADARHTPFPFVPGHEFMGEIVAIDAEAEAAWRVDVGDRVAVENIVRCGRCRACMFGDPADRSSCAAAFVGYSARSIHEEHGLWGGMSEYLVLVPGTRVHPIADGLSNADASLYNLLSNAIHWVSDVGRVVLGERVLVLGAGQRGLGVCAVAAQAAASQVIVTGLRRDRHKLDLATHFGATDTVDVEDRDLIDVVRELTGGAGVDLVVDSVPVATEPTVQALEVLRHGGRLVLAGVKGTGRTLDGFVPDLLTHREHQILGAAGSPSAAVVAALGMLADGRYPYGRLQTHEYGLDDAERAIRLQGGEPPDEPAIHVTINPWL